MGRLDSCPHHSVAAAAVYTATAAAGAGSAAVYDGAVVSLAVSVGTRSYEAFVLLLHGERMHRLPSLTRNSRHHGGICRIPSLWY